MNESLNGAFEMVEANVASLEEEMNKRGGVGIKYLISHARSGTIASSRFYFSYSNTYIIETCPLMENEIERGRVLTLIDVINTTEYIRIFHPRESRIDTSAF